MYGFLKEMNIVNTQRVAWNILGIQKILLSDWKKRLIFTLVALPFFKKIVWEVVSNSKVFALYDIILSSLPRKRSEMRSKCLPVA